MPDNNRENKDNNNNRNNVSTEPKFIITNNLRKFQVQIITTY